MKTFSTSMLALGLAWALATSGAQAAGLPEARAATARAPAAARFERPRANQGQIPPAPMKRALGTEPEAERGPGSRIDNTPHVNQNHWYGHDRPDDPRYALVTPFLYGHFAHSGPGYRYGIAKVDIDRHLLWLPGDYQFRVADWDWPIWSQWCADCGDDFVFYEDPDHQGWYLLYDVHLGRYVHVEYLGRNAT